MIKDNLIIHIINEHTACIDIELSYPIDEWFIKDIRRKLFNIGFDMITKPTNLIYRLYQLKNLFLKLNYYIYIEVKRR